MERIVIRVGACGWGAVVSQEEDDARHEIYEADLVRRVRALYPGASVELHIDRRTDASPQITCYPDERQSDADAVWLASQEAWQHACEAKVEVSS